MIRMNRKLITLILLIFVLLLALHQKWSEQTPENSNIKNLPNDKKPEKVNVGKSRDTECGKVLKLPYFPENNPDKNQQTFFIETSNQTEFKGRQLCAIESAIRNGKLPVKIILRSATLPVKHPALCSLMDEFYPKKLSFYTSSLEPLFANIPLQGITSRLDWTNRAFKIQGTVYSGLSHYSPPRHCSAHYVIITMMRHIGYMTSGGGGYNGKDTLIWCYQKPECWIIVTGDHFPDLFCPGLYNPPLQIMCGYIAGGGGGCK